jgi:hypothetical protein
MVPPRCPAAYVRGAGDWPVLAEAAVRRGWPVPVVYGERPGQAGGARPALVRLQAAVGRGGHDGLLVMLPGLLGNAPWLMGLLRSCTRHGVTVGFVPGGPGARLRGASMDASARPPGHQPRARSARGCSSARYAESLGDKGGTALDIHPGGWLP